MQTSEPQKAPKNDIKRLSFGTIAAMATKIFKKKFD